MCKTGSLVSSAWLILDRQCLFVEQFRSIGLCHAESMIYTRSLEHLIQRCSCISFAQQSSFAIFLCVIKYNKQSLHQVYISCTHVKLCTQSLDWYHINNSEFSLQVQRPFCPVTADLHHRYLTLTRSHLFFRPSTLVSVLQLYLALWHDFKRAFVNWPLRWKSQSLNTADNDTILRDMLILTFVLGNTFCIWM